ncbi:hypothetical protein C3E89_06085, partial [Clostridium sp. Cult1]|nr:hypothetical protein [Clostridium sp. Cult1]
MEGVWEWGPATGVDPVPFEGENLAGTILGGNYSNYADDWMVTPPIDLRDINLEAASLRFYQWYNMENNYDNGYIYVTDNYGEEWNQVGTITNSSNGWQEVVINLNDYIGSTNPIFVGYRFKSDVSQAREGWYIDNVRLIGPDSEAPQVPTDLRVETGMTGIKLSWIPSPDGDISHYNIYRSIISGEEYEKIGETSSNTFLDTEVVANTTYYYVISSEDTSGNESDFTNEVSAIASEVYILYYSDFEEDNGEFITGGTGNLWEWGIPTSGPNGAASGEKLWATILDGNYETRVDAYIESPEIVIPEDKIPYLLFNHWYNTENRYDYGFVEVSNDDGITWEKVTGNFTSSSDGWVNEEIPLTTYRGDTIKIRFNFHSDISVVREGWYIDDVTIVGLNFIPPEQEVITYDDGTNENAVVLNEAGNGLAVRFTPTLSGKLVGADIYLDDDFPEPTANRLGFEIYQINEDGTISRVGETLYVDNLIRGAFNYIDLSDFNFYTAGEDFYVSTMQDSIGDLTPGTGIDNDSAYESRSYLNIAGEMLPMSDEGIAGALMIRAHMDYTQTPPENLEPETGKVRTKLTKISSSKLNKGTTTLKAEEKEKISEPDFRINRNNITLNGYKYEMVSDKEVANTPMARGGGIPADDAVVTILETGRSVRTNPATGEYSMRIPMGDYTLQAEAYGYYPQTVEVS